MTSKFEIERNELMAKLTVEMEQLKNGLGELNQNLESLNNLGNEFTAPAKNWHFFHKSVMEPDDIPTAQNVITRATTQQREDPDHNMPSADDNPHSSTHHHSDQRQQQQQH